MTTLKWHESQPIRSDLEANALVSKAFAEHLGSDLLENLRSLQADCYLVGGAVRDLIVGVGAPKDLDLVVGNGDEQVHRTLAQVGPSRRNRHGNWRYFLSPERHIDVIEPRFFYRSFTNATDTLSFFDVSVNALGIRLHDGHVLNPLNGLEDLVSGMAVLPAERWQGMSDFESVHLTLRLLRLLKRMPLTVVNPELALSQLAKFENVDWVELYRLNEMTRDEARNDLLEALASPADMRSLVHTGFVVA